MFEGVATISIALVTLIISILTFAFIFSNGVIFYMNNRDRQENKESIRNLERRYDLLRERHQGILKEMEHFSDSILIAYNDFLDDEKKIEIDLLRYILYLRHPDDNEKIRAIWYLKERGNKKVMPHLEWVIATHPNLKEYAQSAIDCIKKRLEKESN